LVVNRDGVTPANYSMLVVNCVSVVTASWALARALSLIQHRECLSETPHGPTSSLCLAVCEGVRFLH
jgi:hypothetical protein